MRPDQPKWDYGRQEYKDYDSHCEPGLISVLFLSCGRPEITKACLQSTIKNTSQYSGEIEWILLDQGDEDETLPFFLSLDLKRKVILKQDNFGINNGLNQLFSLSRGEFCMIHENDWFCSSDVDFMSISMDIFREREDIGIVQLRAVWDPRENWGLRKPEYSPWSSDILDLEKSKISLFKQRTMRGHRYLISDFPNGYNHNPIMIRKELLRNIMPIPEAPIGSDPRHGETQIQEEIAKLGYLTAHVGAEIYYHKGQVTTKGV